MSSHRLFNLMHGREHETGDKPAYRFGRWAHTYILEGEAEFWKSHVVGGPVNESTGRHYGFETKRYDAFAERIMEFVDVVTPPAFQVIQAMRASVLGINEAARMLGDGEAELVGRACYRDVACQIRCDWLTNKSELVDLKTCRDITRFDSDAMTYGYLHQLAFYRQVLRIITDADWKVYLLAVEKTALPRSSLIRVNQSMLDNAQADNELALDAIEPESVYRRSDLWS